MNNNNEITINLDQVENALNKMTMKTCETFRMVIEAQQNEIKRLKDKYEPAPSTPQGNQQPSQATTPSSKKIK